MKRSRLVQCGWLVVWLVILAVPTELVAQHTTQTSLFSIDSDASFEAQIVPIFSQFGCNQASCHGASGGRGGFELSLFGARPADDYRAIVVAEQGRRVQWNRAQESLLLTKPTATLDHEGDLRFDIGSAPWLTLKQWIEAGAPYGKPLEFESIEATPNRIAAHEGNASSEVRVTRIDASGNRVDVTQDSYFDIEDPASVQRQGNRFSTSLPGEHRVFVRYAGKFDVIRLVVPFAQPTNGTAPALASGEEIRSQPSNGIDIAIDRKLQELGLVRAQSASRSSWLRRVSIDLVGRLPSSEEAREFLGDHRPDAAQRWLERFLASPDFEVAWSYHASRWLDVDGVGDLRAAVEYRRWLTEQLRQDAAWPMIAQSLVQARGDSHRVGAAGFYRGTMDPRIQVERFSEQLLGSRLRCANCHDHPLDRWTQDDYHGLAAIFAQVSQQQVVEDRPAGSVRHPRTQIAATPQLPGARSARAALTTTELAQWLAEDSFATWQVDAVLVNRVWSVLLGTGLVHPIDDWRATNPASHPELLTDLVTTFRNDQQAIRPLIRRIVMSQTYALAADDLVSEEFSARQGELDSQTGRSDPDVLGEQKALRWHQRAIHKPLGAELLMDQLVQVTEVPEVSSQGATIGRSIALDNRNQTSESLLTLGRCPVGGNCAADLAGPTNRELRQGLHWINGPLVIARLENEEGWLMRSWRRCGNASLWLERELDEWYWRCYSRAATGAERDFWSRELLASSDEQEQQAVLIDLAWATLAAQEFWARP